MIRQRALLIAVVSFINILGGAFLGGEPAALASPGCAGDVTGDHAVNVNDLLAVINSWGPCPAPPALCPADITHDGVVNIDDLLAVINSWGACP